MSDRITAIIAVPVDDALPLDVQGVGLRRLAIERMSEVAKVDESTVRFKSASADATIYGDGDYLSLWQHNLMAAVFHADGKAHREIVGDVSHHDKVSRVRSHVSVVRNEYD